MNHNAAGVNKSEKMYLINQSNKMKIFNTYNKNWHEASLVCCTYWTKRADENLKKIVEQSPSPWRQSMVERISWKGSIWFDLTFYINADGKLTWLKTKQ